MTFNVAIRTVSENDRARVPWFMSRLKEETLGPVASPMYKEQGRALRRATFRLPNVSATVP